jgi:hypothetical protein
MDLPNRNNAQVQIFLVDALNPANQARIGRVAGELSLFLKGVHIMDQQLFDPGQIIATPEPLSLVRQGAKLLAIFHPLMNLAFLLVFN